LKKFKDLITKLSNELSKEEIAERLKNIWFPLLAKKRGRGSHFKELILKNSKKFLRPI